MHDPTHPAAPPRFIDAQTIAERMEDACAFGARLEDDPGDLLAEARLESIYRSQGNWSGLVELLLDRAAVATDDVAAIAILCEVASIYELSLGDGAAALVVLLAAFERDPSSAGVADALDKLAYQTGQWDDVIDSYMVAAGKTNEESPTLAGELWLRIACAHLVTTGDMGAVSEALTRVRRLESGRLGAYLDMVERRISSLAMLDTLIELYRRIGDDDRRASCLSRAVAMAQDVSTKSRYHLAIGDLSERRGDSDVARWHYTEALRLDASRAGAREALVSIYRREGNQRELASLLASSRFTASQTEQAEVALEAAAIYADELDEQTRAANLYAFAFSQDPEHVGAALPLAERYYEEKRWHELGPVLDLLIARGSELGPSAPDLAQLHLQRAQCASALGDAVTARAQCEKALEIDSSCEEAQRELAAACSELGDHDGACDALNKILVLQRKGKVGAADRAATLFEMARTRRAVRDDAAALTLYESGLELAFSLDAFVEARAIYEAKGDFTALVSCARAQLAKSALSERDRVPLLSVVAEVLGSRRGDGHGAIEAYEQAHAIAPTDRGVLHQLIEFYSAAEMWEQAVHSMRKVASLESDPIRRGKVYQAAGTIARHHLDVGRTVELYNRALDCFFGDKVRVPETLRTSCMKAFTDLARTLYGAREFKELERNYRQMIRRMRAGDAELPELWHGLGQVYRKHLRKTEEAIESFEVASALDRGRVTHHRILIDLYRNSPTVSVDQIDKAIERRLALIDHEPFAAEHYRELRSLYLRAGNHDGGWSAARALTFLRAADREERSDYQEGKNSGAIARGQLSPTDWEALRSADEDPTISTILGLVSEAVRNASAAPARKLGLRDDRSPLFDHLRSMFAAEATALGLPALDICVQPEIGGDVLLANIKRGRGAPPTFAVGRALYDGQSLDAISYTLGRTLTYGRPEYLLRLVVPNPAELEAVFLAASSLSRADVPVSPILAPRVAHYQALLARRLRPEWRRALAAAVEAFVVKGRPFCLETWGLAVDRTARRAGLLVSGDLSIAVAKLPSEPRVAAAGSAEEKIRDLLVHSVSGAHLALRKKLGLSLATTDRVHRDRLRS